MQCLLVRHAHCASVDTVLAGRMPGVLLDESGLRQAAALADALAHEPLSAIYSSPRERALATATAIANAHQHAVRTHNAFDELDWGAWTGLTFAELATRADWRAYHAERGRARIPGGESLAEAQARARAGIEELRARHGDAPVAIVTHAEIVRLLLAACLEIPLEHALRVQVDPASISRVRWSGTGPLIAAVNLTIPAAPAAQTPA